MPLAPISRPSLGVALVTLALSACPSVSEDPQAQHPIESPIARTHSHNDELQARPLEDALALRFASIEVDVLVYEGELVAAHDIFQIAGGFERLYLEPLQERVAARGGSVYGDGTPFVLWVDLKSGAPIVRDAVHEALSRYDMITRFADVDADGRQGAVDVIFTGDESSKLAYVEEHEVRYACRDSNAMRAADPPLDDKFCAYALDFADVVGEPWDVAAIEAVVTAAGARPVRLWNAPETPEAWRAQRDAGVAWVGTDDLAGLVEAYSADAEE